MDILYRLPRATIAETVAVARAALELLILIDMQILARAKNVPPLYRSGVRFQPEPRTSLDLGDVRRARQPLERFDPIPIVLARGWGDCDDLVGWRIAELRAEGEEATPRIMWPEGQRRYHAQVRRADGTIEDPSHTLRRANGVRR